jgi:hypothetical protein
MVKNKNIFSQCCSTELHNGIIIYGKLVWMEEDFAFPLSRAGN